METRVFRTNLSNTTCIASISPFLDQDPEIEAWEADVAHQLRPLRVSGEAVDICHVRGLIRDAGFDVYEEIPTAALNGTPISSIPAPRTYQTLLIVLGSLGIGYLAGLSVSSGLK